MESGSNHGDDSLTRGEEMQAMMFGIEVEDEDDARLLGVSRLTGEDFTAFHKRIGVLKDKAGLEIAKQLGIAKEGMSEPEIQDALYEYAARMRADEHGVKLQEFENMMSLKQTLTLGDISEENRLTASFSSSAE